MRTRQESVALMDDPTALMDDVIVGGLAFHKQPLLFKINSMYFLSFVYSFSPNIYHISKFAFLPRIFKVKR